jgi:hypothetical protein
MIAELVSNPTANIPSLYTFLAITDHLSFRAAAAHLG